MPKERLNYPESEKCMSLNSSFDYNGRYMSHEPWFLGKPAKNIILDIVLTLLSCLEEISKNPSYWPMWCPMQDMSFIQRSIIRIKTAWASS